MNITENQNGPVVGIEFIRLPKKGLEPITGLSRAKLCELILPSKANGFRPPVKSVCLRRPGANKGARLIKLQSLLDYLNSRLEGGADAPEAKSPCLS